MIRFSVKKPYFTVVAVIIILVLGAVSMTKMKTDLLPEIGLPYLMIITTEPGASPEKVEEDVTRPIEDAVGKISGVKNVVSNSAENYSLVMLEFVSNTNMDSAMVRVSSALNVITLPEICGTPNIMEISMDMMATMYATVSYEGRNITELTDFTEETIVPYLQRQDGVASITQIGSVNETMEVRLNEDKIDKLNEELLLYTNDKLADAKKEITKAKNKLKKADKELTDGGKTLSNEQENTNDQLSEALSGLDDAKATKAAYQASLASLNASKSALEGEKKAYQDNNIEENYNSINQMFSGFNQTIGSMASGAGIQIPENIKDAVDNPEKLAAFTGWMSTIGYKEEVSALSHDILKTVYDIVEVRIPQIDTELANLSVEIKAAEAVNKTITEQMKDIEDNYKTALSGALSATSGFATAGAQIESGKTSIKDAKKELNEAEKTFKESKKAALENANLDELLSLDALSGLIYAQNFSMPAGYIDDTDDNQWLLKVGNAYESLEDIRNMVLCRIKGIGNIRLKDVSDVSVIDNADSVYAKYNKDDTILLAIYKMSTANTSEVSDNCRDAIDYLEEKYPGVSIVPFSDQSTYISMFLDSVLYSMFVGALLAIVVLVLFLKSVKPTLIVAFSIPFSVLFAIIIMYFTGININVMSLAGLALAIGMLVDNSIVVIENIFRIRSKGVAPARAAVQGAKQVSSAIISSTLTTICVFLPMVFTSGIVRDLVIPFAFTITYALTASLIVALTIVPTMASVALKKTKQKSQPIYNKIQKGYVGILKWCLKYKIAAILTAAALLVFSIVMVFRMGIVMIPDMSSDTINVMAEMPEDTDKETAVALADEIIDSVISVEGVKEMCAMDNMGMTNMVVGGAVSAESGNSFSGFIYYIIPEDDITTVNKMNRLVDDIKNSLKDIPCEITVGSDEATSELMSSGLSVNIYGDDTDTLISISNDIKTIMEGVDGVTNVMNGLEDADKAVQLTIDKDAAAQKGLTVAQIYNEISTGLTTEKVADTVSIDGEKMNITIVDETDTLSYDSLMDLELEAVSRDDNGEEKTKTYKLSDFAVTQMVESASVIQRENQTQYITVSSEMEEGANATLASRELEPLIDNYDAPEGYSVEISGEPEEVEEMLNQMLLAILLGFILIYLVMVAQFQSLLSPFIIIFTIPLAFTGGFLGLLIFGEEISAMALIGFMVLMGTVVNNGIVFVDYVNQLRIQGLDKKNALIATGRTRLRPIIMTALTTVLAMGDMVFSNDTGSVMAKGMAIVISGGLIYSTVMTLIIVPIMYDLLYRKQPKVIDVGDDLDDVINDAEDYMLNER